MATHEFNGTIDVPASRTWETVRAFGNGAWMGVEVTCEGEGVGARRTIAMGDSSLVEECERLDDDARVLGYTIVEAGGMPFEDYHSTITIGGDDERTELTWAATYEPVGDPGVATATLDAIYGGGFAGLKKHLEG